MLKEKGFAPLIFILGIVIMLGIVGGAYYLRTLKSTRPQIQNPVITPNSPQPTISPTPTATQASTDKLNYTDPAGRFSFTYPSNLQFTDSPSSFCNANYNLPNKAVVLTSQSYTPQGSSILGVEYSFGVSSDPSSRGEDSCYISPQDKSKLIKSISYNNQVYYMASTGGAAAGCHGFSDIYRTLYKNQCYEISINWTEDSDWNNPADMQIASSEQDKAFTVLKNILSTFKFTDQNTNNAQACQTDQDCQNGSNCRVIGPMIKDALIKKQCVAPGTAVPL